MPVAKVSPINPVLGGGALKIIGEGGSGINDGGLRILNPHKEQELQVSASNVCMPLVIK